MSGRGGRRPGAGRPPGSKNQRTVEIARAAVEAGITPIEVMLNAMRELWDQGTPESKREAATIAKDAAPYVHPRLSNVDQNINEIQPYAYVVETCRTAEEWEAQARADLEEATPDQPAGSYLSLRKSGT
jgi:formiminotetrahydrofolate cyclodeaminase